MIVLIPAYEPDEKMLRLIQTLNSKTDYKIVIVDDGSGPKYQTIFDEAQLSRCTVLHHFVNRGKGAALKTGFQYLLDHSASESVVCADCDGQHSVSDIVKVAAAIDGKRPEMVLGIREFRGSIPLKSSLGNRVSAWIFRLSTGIPLRDTQTGLRGYPFQLLPWLCSIEGERFEYELNLLIRSRSSGISIRQLPIATIYENHNKSTHFRPFHDSIRVLLPLLKFSASSILSGCLDFILYFLIRQLTGSLLPAVVLARVISSIVNYSLNDRLVFNRTAVPHKRSAPGYFALVGALMILNYLFLFCLTEFIGISVLPAKLLTELILFGLSYGIQRRIIFRNPEHLKLFQGTAS